MALRDSMRDSAAPYLRPGETVQAVLGAQTASQLVAAVSGVFLFLGLNRYRIVAVTSQRVRPARADQADPVGEDDTLGPVLAPSLVIDGWREFLPLPG